MTVSNLRVFGVVVKSKTFTAADDAEVKLTVNFDALYCYTDTGRLEDANKGDRYTAHRMFENTANSVVTRKKAGIAPNTEKPFFFYNGQISSFGINIAQVTNFSLSGNNNAEAIIRFAVTVKPRVATQPVIHLSKFRLVVRATQI